MEKGGYGYLSTAQSTLRVLINWFSDLGVILLWVSNLNRDTANAETFNSRSDLSDAVAVLRSLSAAPLIITLPVTSTRSTKSFAIADSIVSSCFGSGSGSLSSRGNEEFKDGKCSEQGKSEERLL